MTDPRRAVLDGPTYIRLLAGLAGADLRPDGAALSERLADAFADPASDAAGARRL